MSKTPYQRPSARPSPQEAAQDPRARSIKPSELRSRALLAGLCATLFGAFVVSGIVRSCEGGDLWEDKPSSPEPAH